MTMKRKYKLVTALSLAGLLLLCLPFAKSQRYATDVVNSLTEMVEKPESTISVSSFNTGAPITIRLNDGILISGTINCVQEVREPDYHVTLEENKVIGGECLIGDFTFSIKNNIIEGLIVSYEDNLAYILEKSPIDSTSKFVVKPLGDVMCLLDDQPKVDYFTEYAVSKAPALAFHKPVDNAPIPVLNSRVGASTVLYLDFAGGTLQDPLWNRGRTFTYKSSGLTTDEMTKFHQYVSQKYDIFNINVTTSKSVFDSYQGGRKLRCIITNEIYALLGFPPGVIGVAHTGSFPRIGSSTYRADHPCFVLGHTIVTGFEASQYTETLAGIAAHETGHVFGLGHDGLSPNPYLNNLGKWGPLMGNPFGDILTQWSQGEYYGSTNKQPDISVIANNPNVGYIDGNSSLYKSGTSDTTSTISDKAVFLVGGSIKSYELNVTTNSNIIITVKTPKYSSCNTKIEIYNDKGVLISMNDPLETNDSSFNGMLNVGKYIVKVISTGEGKPFSPERTTKFTAYGSVGSVMIDFNAPKGCTILKK